MTDSTSRPTATHTAGSVDDRPVRARPRDWAALVVLMLPVLLVSIDNTVLSFALPEISLEFATSGTTLLWIVDSYPLVLAGLLVAMGSFGDRFGRRRMLIVGAIGFGVLSVVAAFVESAGALVASRAALGFFGAMLMPSTLSLLRNIFLDREQRRLALAIWASGFAAGSALGPIVGGFLIEGFGWRSVFLLAVPMLALMLVFTPLLVPESKDPRPGPIDPLSVVLSIATLFPLVLAIKSLATDGFGPVAMGGLTIAALAGVWFVRRQLARPVPMLDVRLFSYAPFSGAVLVNFLAVFSLTGFLYFGAQHLQLVLGLGPVQSGLLLLPGLLMMIAMGLAAVRIVKRVHPRVVISAALVLSAVGYLLIAVVGNGTSGVALAVAFAVLSAGIGASETLSNDLIVSAVPAEKAGSAAGISETAYEVGAVFGTAVLGSILVSSYRDAIDLPAGLSDRQQAISSETLGGAINVAGELPAPLGQALIETARHAFDSGITTTAGIGAVLMVAASYLAWRTLRHAR